MRLPFLIAAALLSAPAAAATVSGAATVIDGDTLEIGGKRIRLVAIDAPEATQSCDRAGERWACGEASAAALRTMIGGYQLTCNGAEVDAHGRLLAVCTVAGIDLNQAMVSEGWAVAFRRYSDAYVRDEGRARSERRGLWASSFVSPEEYRAAERVAAEPPLAAMRQPMAPRAASSCLIKGNHSRRGEWIYHLPGMPYYDATRPEAMFCSEAEAVAAGYRKAKTR